jgi:hypothetical protein
MGGPMVKFPVVCPDCLKEHLAAIPVDMFAEALADRISLQDNRHQTLSRDASPAALEQLHDYLAAIIRCPPHQSRFSTVLGLTERESH